MSNGSTTALIEAERRLGENWKGEFEARLFTNIDDDDLTAAFKEDNVLTLRLTRYF